MPKPIIIDNGLTKRIPDGDTLVVGGLSVESTAGLSVGSTSPAKYAATSPASLSGSVNDYNLGTGTFFRIAADDGGYAITGIAGGADGRLLYLACVDSGVTLKNEDVSSAATNRIITGTGVDVNLSQDNVATLIYDSTTQRWRVVAVQQ